MSKDVWVRIPPGAPFIKELTMIEHLYTLLILHALGDYVFQSDFLAQTKGTNWWHLIIHSLLYTVPFYLYFGYDHRVITLLVSHVVIDALKARYNAIDYISDQCLHLWVLLVLF